MAEEGRSRAAGWGWGILLVIASLIALNGISWIFFGPDAVVSSTAENIGVSVTEFEEAYPAAIDAITVNQYQVATYLVAIGAMGLLAALAGYRLRYRWAWHITWVLVATPAALVAGGLAAGYGVGGFLAMMLLLALLALAGQLLAGRQPGHRRPS
jgi:hypothetical protein